MEDQSTSPETSSSTASSPNAEIRHERIAYRVSGHGKAQPVRSHIRNQDVAFDIHDEGEANDTDSDIA